MYLSSTNTLMPASGPKSTLFSDRSTAFEISSCSDAVRTVVDCRFVVHPHKQSIASSGPMPDRERGRWFSMFASIEMSIEIVSGAAEQVRESAAFSQWPEPRQLKAFCT